MGDEAVKIYLNADQIMDDVRREWKAFLDYVADKRLREIERKKDDKDYRLKLYRKYQVIWEQTNANDLLIGEKWKYS